MVLLIVVDKNGIATAVWVQAGSIYSATADMSVAVLPGEENSLQQAARFFVHRAAVCYTLDRGARVTIAVFNLRGERLLTLVDEYESAGSAHIVALPLRDLGKGQYLVQCKVGDAVIVKKLAFAD
jgi:hypothetical protein